MKPYMMYINAFAVILVFIRCNSTPPRDDAWKQELANLRHEVDSLKNLQSSIDTGNTSNAAEDVKPAQSASPESTAAMEKEKTVTPIPETKKPSTLTPEKNPVPTDPVVKTSAEEKFFYSSGKLSLVIKPWIEDERKLIFYAPSGEVMYTQEDVRHSYSNISEVNSFHPNGAVAKITVHNNPGASMYWSESVITFNESNEPEWMNVTQYPMRSLEQSMGNTYYWDKTKGSWVKKVISE